MAQVRNGTDYRTSNCNPCWRWDGSQWVEAEDLKLPLHSDSNQSFGTNPYSGDSVFYSVPERPAHLPAHQLPSLDRAEARNGKSSIAGARQPYSYERLLHETSLSHLVRTTRAVGIERFRAETRPGMEFLQRRRAPRYVEKEPQAYARASTAETQAHEPVLDRVPGAAANVARKNSAQRAVVQTVRTISPSETPSNQSVKHKFGALVDVLKEEGSKSAGEIDPSIIVRLCHDLEQLTAALPGEADGQIDLTPNRLQERVALLETDLRTERGIRSAAFQQLEHQLRITSRRLQWLWMSLVAAGLLALLAGAVKLIFALAPPLNWLR